MSSLQLPGLSTGLDTKTLIAQLMQVERRRLTLFQNQIDKKKQTQTAVNELQSKLNGFKTALNALSDASQLRAFSAVSSNTDKVTVKAAGSAHEGSHSVQVKQLATANRWVHSGFKYATSYVGAGTFIFSYNNQEMVVQTTDKTTLQDMVNLINNDPTNPGVTASILKYDDGSGNPYHLVLNGRQSGTDYQIRINTSNTEVQTAASVLTSGGANAALTTKISTLSDFSGQSINFLAVNEVAVTGTRNDGTAASASIAVNQHTTIADLIEQIEDVFGDTVKVTLDEGQLKITDKTSGVSQMTLSLSFNTPTDSATLSFNRTVQGGSMTANIAAFAPNTFVETQRAQDSLIKVDDYPPGADTWISRSTNTVDDVIAGVTLNLHGTTANTTGGYDKLEVNLTRDTDALKTKMQAMMDAYNALAMYFDEKTKYDPETNTSGILSREFGLTSIRSLIKNPFAANATGFGGSDTFINPSQLGLSFGTDGMLKLDETKFNEAINKDYLGVLSLVGAQKTGSSSGGDAASLKFYASSKYTQAGTYNVRVTVDASGTITAAQIKRSNEDWSQARDAEFSGNYVYGASGPLNARNPEMDLQVAVDTTQTNRTLETTLTIRQGFAGSLFDIVNNASDASTGRVSATKKSIESQIKNLNQRIETEEARLEKTQERLTLRYARLEKLLTAIQRQFSGIQQVG